jgi:hypothetical protein
MLNVVMLSFVVPNEHSSLLRYAVNYTIKVTMTGFAVSHGMSASYLFTHNVTRSNNLNLYHEVFN